MFLPHVQGLRAVAVLAVMIHHIAPKYLPGGFIGVDIFFVISGYLITNHIQAQRAASNFSLRGFYFRRIRRIIPNQILVIIAVLIAAYYLLDAAAFQLTAASAAYSALMMANVFFLQHSGYFAPAAETMPLLHVWSLAVEEQFYLVWPCALIALSTLKANLRPWMLGIGALALLGLTEWAIQSSPNAAFYMMPFRILEFMCGGLLVLFKPTIWKWRSAVSLIALAIIAACLFLYSPATRFPGLAALIPCVATGAVIAFGSGASTQRLLGNKLALAIGERSYAMYLVHWPVIVFLKASYPVVDPLASVPAILGITVLLTEILFRAWEKPLRYSSLPRPSGRLVYGAVVFLSSASIALVGVYIGKDYMAGKTDEDFTPRLTGCLDPNQTELTDCGADAIIIGDSHSGHMQTYFRAVSTGTVARSAFAGCPPIFGAYKIYNHWRAAKSTPVCRDLIEQWESDLPNTDASTIVLAARWAWLVQPGDYAGEVIRQDWLVTSESSPQTTEHSRKVLREQLDYTIRTLQAAGKRVVLIGQVPLRTNGEILCARANAGNPGVGEMCRAVSREEAMARLRFMDQTIRDLGQKYPDLETVIPSEIMCGEECIFAIDGELLYSDADHLNEVGANWLAARVSLIEPFSK